MNLIVFGGVLWLLVILNRSVNVVGDGMIEVFGWKQMDFYNRGERAPVPGGAPNRGAGGGGGSYYQNKFGSPSNAGSVVFPDRLQSQRLKRSPENRRVRSKDEVVTSRDQPRISINGRFGPAPTAQSENASYIPYNNVPMGVTHHKGRLFITMPRRRTGIPSTLNYIDMQKDGKNSSPKLRAYPNFEMNYLNPNLQPNRNRIISVYRTTADACKRLWFIDTGMLEYPDNRMQLQPPSIWVIDLATDQVLHRFEIPESVVDTGRGLASITVDVQAGKCDDAFAYIPDLVNRQLFVYSLGNGHIWSFSHNYFNFDPLAGDLNVGGQTFRWDDGIFSITLGARAADGYSTVYFHPMASNNEFVVNSRVLQNESYAARSDHGNDFEPLGSRGPKHQSTMHEYDPTNNVIFYAEIQRNGVGCWNTNKQFSAQNHGTVIQDAQRMIYPSDLTIDEDGVIWVMTNSMPIFIYSSLDPNIVNFRVWKQDVGTAAKYTICEP